jgi:hypothetical protein
MKAFTAAFLIFVLTNSGFACAWITGTKYSGERHTVSGFSGARLVRSEMQMALEMRGANMETELRGDPGFSQRNDYAVSLMFLNRSKEAVDLLLQLEKEKPGEYFVAANLGTAYELTGNNEEGLRWINEGIRRNPNSHNGTEWLHARILEAKIAQDKDAGFFKKHSVLDLQPGKIGQIETGGKLRPPAEITKALKYQLIERVQFVKPPDAAVASLLFDYAIIEAATHSMESAKGLLELAVEYGYPSDRVATLLKDFESRIFWAKARTIGFYSFVGIAIITLIIVGFWKRWIVYRRYR